MESLVGLVVEGLTEAACFVEQVESPSAQAMWIFFLVSSPGDVFVGWSFSELVCQTNSAIIQTPVCLLTLVQE